MGNYEAVKLLDSFWSIEDGGVRCFLIAGEDRAVLVDTGFGTGDIRAFCRSLTEAPVEIINTHGDPDHTGCNHLFGEARMHPAEYDYYIRRREENGQVRLKPIWEGELVSAGPYSFEVILVPGHTPGSIALLERRLGILISGDSVQTGAVYMFGPGRNLPGYLASLEKLERMEHAIKRIFPSHGEIEVPLGMIGEMLEGGRRLLHGELEGREMANGMPCRLYSYGKAKFYY